MMMSGLPFIPQDGPTAEKQQLPAPPPSEDSPEKACSEKGISSNGGIIHADSIQGETTPPVKLLLFLELPALLPVFCV
jgi:hypothetical protein